MPNYSSDPEADADTLDDDELLQAYLEQGQAQSDPQPVSIADWPPGRDSQMITLAPQITAWFKARHADWQREINVVLRAWIAAHEQRGALPEESVSSRTENTPG